MTLVSISKEAADAAFSGVRLTDKAVYISLGPEFSGSHLWYVMGRDGVRIYFVKPADFVSINGHQEKIRMVKLRSGGVRIPFPVKGVRTNPDNKVGYVVFKDWRAVGRPFYISYVTDIECDKGAPCIPFNEHIRASDFSGAEKSNPVVLAAEKRGLVASSKGVPPPDSKDVPAVITMEQALAAQKIVYECREAQAEIARLAKRMDELRIFIQKGQEAKKIVEAFEAQIG